MDHYESKAKAYRRLNANQTMLWFDGVKTSPSGSRISTDVIVEDEGRRGTGGNYGGGGGDYGGGGGGGGASGQYRIEIIAVETHDPKSVLDEEPSPSN